MTQGGNKPGFSKGYSFISMMPAPCQTLEDIWEKQVPVSQKELQFRLTGRRLSKLDPTTAGQTTMAQSTFESTQRNSKGSLAKISGPPSAGKLNR